MGHRWEGLRWTKDCGLTVADQRVAEPVSCPAVSRAWESVGAGLTLVLEVLPLEFTYVRQP